MGVRSATLHAGVHWRATRGISNRLVKQAIVVVSIFIDDRLAQIAAGEGGVDGGCRREKVGDRELSVAKTWGPVGWGHVLHVLEGAVVSR